MDLYSPFLLYNAPISVFTHILINNFSKDCFKMHVLQSMRVQLRLESRKKVSKDLLDIFLYILPQTFRWKI